MSNNKSKSKMMRKKLVLAACMLITVASYARWNPSKDRVRTQWAEEVDPADVLPEYPRPLMERPQWNNLNGLWDYAILPVGAAEPEAFDGKIWVPFAIKGGYTPFSFDVTPYLKRSGKQKLAVEGHLWQPDKNRGDVQFKSSKEVTDEYIKYAEQLKETVGRGYLAAVYTQTIDVEGEVNGLMTYDRKVIKQEEDRLKKINTEGCNFLRSARRNR
jgi:hypothetical protein